MDRISTHAPAGGATVHLFQILVAKGISTHAPAGGATNSVTRLGVVDVIFLLTPLREGRRRRGFLLKAPKYFYSRPCGRGDPAIPPHGLGQ